MKLLNLDIELSSFLNLILEKNQRIAILNKVFIFVTPGDQYPVICNPATFVRLLDYEKSLIICKILLFFRTGDQSNSHQRCDQCITSHHNRSYPIFAKKIVPFCPESL